MLRAIRKVYTRALFPSYAEYPDPNRVGAYTMRSLNFPSAQGSPHYCDRDYRATSMWADYCPCARRHSEPHDQRVSTLGEGEP